MVPYLLRLLHPTALASLFATFGRVTYETIASYGTRFVVCDLRACRLQEALPSPSVLTPCDDRMLQSQVKRQAQLVLGEPVERSPIVSQSEL